MSARTTKGRVALVVAVVAVAFTALVAWHYHFRINAAALFLVGAGSSLLVAGWLLVKTALSFDLEVTPLPSQATDDERRRAQLVQEKKLLLKAIKEMEFDRDTGKVEPAEAEQAIHRYRTRALEILEAMEPEHDERWEAVIETELQRRLARQLAEEEKREDSQP